jgi:hypothetical protein
LFARDLQARIAEFQSRTGDKSPSLRELLAKGAIPTVNDLAGVPFDFDPATGVVSVSSQSPLWRRPVPAR